MIKLNICLLSLFISQSALAGGLAQDLKLQKYGMDVWGVFIQPVTLKKTNKANSKANVENKPAFSDIHLEAKIRASDNNAWGFIKNAWVPYLTVAYQVEKLGGEPWMTDGRLMPMVANNGPHYGDNIKLNGIGKYKVTYYISPPNLMLHSDSETAAPNWWMPFSFSWEVVYTGIGKKGGY